MPPDIFQALAGLIAASSAALRAVGSRTQAQYLGDAAAQRQVTQQLILACQSLQVLERHAPGLACRISYRERMAAFYRYLVGDPAQLKQDYVYDILRGKIPLLLLEAGELSRCMEA